MISGVLLFHIQWKKRRQCVLSSKSFSQKNEKGINHIHKSFVLQSFFNLGSNFQTGEISEGRTKDGVGHQYQGRGLGFSNFQVLMCYGILCLGVGKNKKHNGHCCKGEALCLHGAQEVLRLRIDFSLFSLLLTGNSPSTHSYPW